MAYAYNQIFGVMSSKTRNSSAPDSDTGDEGANNSGGSQGKLAGSWQTRRVSLNEKYADELEKAQAMSPDELRRLRRRISNRESARRLRKQRSEKLGELQSQQGSLQNRASNLDGQVASAQGLLQQLQAENNILRLELGDPIDPPTCMAQVLDVPTGSAATLSDTHSGQAPSATEACSPMEVTPTFDIPENRSSSHPTSTTHVGSSPIQHPDPAIPLLSPTNVHDAAESVHMPPPPRPHSLAPQNSNHSVAPKPQAPPQHTQDHTSTSSKASAISAAVQATLTQAGFDLNMRTLSAKNSPANSVPVYNPSPPAELQMLPSAPLTAATSLVNMGNLPSQMFTGVPTGEGTHC